MSAIRLGRILVLVAVIGLFGFAAMAQPAAADDSPVVCTASGECGDWPAVDEGPWFCYWAVPGFVDGIYVYEILYPYDESAPSPDDDSAFVYCESGL